MKKFSFSLEKVLGYKEQVEENLRNEHAAAVKDVKDKEAEIEELRKAKEENIERLREAKSGPVTAPAVMMYESWFSVLDRKTDIKKQELEELKEEEARRREKVIEAKKERKSIDILKDKKIREYRKAAQKEQELLVEEFVASRKKKAADSEL